MDDRDTDRLSALPRRLEGRTSVIGTDTVIRRLLPNRALRTVGAWCFLDHAGPVRFTAGNGMHVGPHPHIGLQTFTWMIEGEIVHRDSLGIEQVIRPGQVNLMTAGHGIVHSEDSVRAGDRLHAAQLWIALPESRRHGAPDFHHHPELPVLARRALRMTVLAGRYQDLRSPVEVYTPLLGLDLQSGHDVTDELPLDPSFEHAVAVLQGRAAVAGLAAGPGELIDLGRGRDRLVVRLDAGAQILLLGGEPLAQAPLLWWNFVARTPDEIGQARADWAAGAARFGPVPGAPTPPIDAPPLAGLRIRPQP